jgi:hypothetical protein
MGTREGVGKRGKIQGTFKLKGQINAYVFFFWWLGL